MYAAGSKFFTSPAMRQLNADASNAVMGAMPFTLLLMALQTGSVPVPTEASSPTPVTTTLRGKRNSQKRPDYFFFDSM
jgi:hypothetical protein